MSGSRHPLEPEPKWKVYAPPGGAGSRYVAACRYPEDAAVLVALHGAGAQIKLRHRKIVWKEGAEAHPAAESYDSAARIILRRAYPHQEVA